MSSEVQKKWELAREVRGSKDKTNGTLCHDIFCPVPFPVPPSDLHRKLQGGSGTEPEPEPLFVGAAP